MAKKRRVFGLSAVERYGVKTPAKVVDDDESESWGHFVDVAEEEEKIVQRSKILSRGSSFASSFGDR